MRILHVVHGLGRGGVETWLMHVLRSVDHARYQFDFLTGTPVAQAYDDEARAQGSRIIYCAPELKLAAYRHRFLGILRANGPYDIVHSHLAFYSGFVLSLAAAAGIKARIAHIHSARGGDGPQRPLLRLPHLLYRKSMRHLICKHAHRGFAISDAAGRYLYGPAWGTDPRFQLLLYGFDYSPFRALPPARELRARLGLPQDALLLGHVGRFNRVKNHAYLVEVFARVLEAEPSAHLALVGDGALRAEIENTVRQRGLAGHVTFAGEQSNVAPWLGAMDGFVFPSFHEGLGIVLVEAQAAGLPIVMSDAVPAEAVVIPELVTALSIGDDPAVWARAILDRARSGKVPDACERVEQSRFGMRRCVDELTAGYEAEACR